MKETINKNAGPLTIVAFALCFIYWIYLIFNSEMVIQHDSYTYEALGVLLNEQGWMAYFKTGPHREPLYPLTVAISMRIADILSTHYQFILKIIQAFVLFVSQILVYGLMGKLRITHKVKLIIILYMGFSPAIVNSVFSLYSEIIVIPFVLAIIFCSVLSWKIILTGQSKQVILMALLTATAFLLAAFGKGVFQYIFLIYLVPFVCVMIFSLIRRKKKIFSNTILYLGVAFAIFYLCTSSYKFMNKIYNGQNTFTDRYSSIFFANAYKRADPLTPKLLMTNISAIPGIGFCKIFFTVEECRACEWIGAEKYMYGFRDEILKDVPKDQLDSKSIELALIQILQHPFKYLLFCGIEATKMMFWESTQIGFVDYPDWLNRLFATTWLKNMLRLLISILTICAFLYLIFSTYRKRSYLFDFSEAGIEVQYCFFILLITFGFIAIYSLCYVLTRYALVIAPLYLVAISYFLNNIRKNRIKPY